MKKIAVLLLAQLLRSPAAPQHPRPPRPKTSKEYPRPRITIRQIRFSTTTHMPMTETTD
jgi:hypothetical protein